MAVKAEAFYNRAREALSRDKTLEALSLFEKALELNPENPVYQSFVGYCIAYERGQVKTGISLCERALQADVQVAEIYYNLGKVYLRAGQKDKAIEVYRQGLKVDDKNAELIDELTELGSRKSLVLPFLPRGSFLNKYLGYVLSKLRLR